MQTDLICHSHHHVIRGILEVITDYLVSNLLYLIVEALVFLDAVEVPNYQVLASRCYNKLLAVGYVEICGCEGNFCYVV